MVKFVLGTMALAGLAAGLAPGAIAGAAPSGPASADAMISRLQSDGFQVVLNRIGTAPLSQCTVGAVRPGQTFTRTDSGTPGAGDDIVTTVINKSVYVDLNC